MKVTYSAKTKKWTDRSGNEVQEPVSRWVPGGSIPQHKAKGWPLHSDAMGVHPDQCQAAYEESVRHGVPTEFDKEGRAIFNDRRHRNAYLQMKGFFDKDGSYGDPTA